jgi:hypothetical protein
MEKQKSIVTPVQKRLFSSQIDILTTKGEAEQAVFQHSVLCQTFFPYRNPGDELTIWTQKQGDVNLAVQVNKAYNPTSDKYETVGLPYGAKARLLLAHINSHAIRNQSPVIDMEQSMTAFVRRTGLDTDGRTINEVKNQLRRLTVSTISLGYRDENRGIQVDLKIVKALEIWFPKSENQRVLWNSQITLTDDYFSSLANHAIPLDERALTALSHNVMSLDIYVWLAQRLHRINREKAQFITWAAIKEQFGSQYRRMCDFKADFRRALIATLSQYSGACIKEDPNKGYWLYQSPPPIGRSATYFLPSAK